MKKSCVFGQRRRRLYRFAHRRGIDRCGVRRGDRRQSLEQRHGCSRGRAQDHGRRRPVRKGRLLRPRRLCPGVRKIRLRFGNPFRGVEGRGRIGEQTVGILPQQPHVVHERHRPDARVRAAEHRLLVVVHRLRRGRRAARHGADAPQARHVALRQHEADVRGYPARLAGRLRGLKGIALRYFNPIGAHPSALIGELPRGVPQNLVPYITQTAAGIRECLSVFGDDYPTPDGSNIRDYIDVVDLAKAHVAAIRRMIEDRNKARYEVFNIGTGRGVSVLELVRKFEEVNNLKLNYKIVGRRAGDIVTIWADPSYANNELGWRAERSLDETLAAAWKWEKHIRGIE